MARSVWLATASLVASATPVWAQDAAAPAPPTVQEGDTGDIIVTATRRNEALSNVPIAVSAVTAETLRNSGASDLRQLTQVSPSLLVSSSSTEAGGAVARIRGVGTVGDNPGLESSVALFIDGVYRSRTAVGLTELGPVDRVEVLRGPQGTLFGRNASAGLISIHTAKPKFATEISGEATIGNYDLRRFGATLNAPLSSTVAARVDGVWMQRDGFLTEVISGRKVNNRDRWLVRGQMLFQPSTDLSVRLIADYAKRNEECCAGVFQPAQDRVRNADGTVGTAAPTVATLERALGATILDDPFARRVSITPGRDYRADVRDWGASAEINYTLGGAQLTSITAYRDNNYVRGQDADFNNIDIWYRASDGTTFNRFKTFTQEVRLQGKALADKLDWLVGGYYANERLTLQDNQRYGADFERYFNCTALTSLLPTAVLLTNPFCVNVPVVQATITGLNALPATDPRRAQIPVLTALIANPARPGLGSLAAAVGLPAFNFNGTGQFDLYRQRSSNFALFTHNIFSLTETVKATVGVRYTREKKRLAFDLTDNNALCRALAGTPLAGLQGTPCIIPSVPNGSFSSSGSKSEGRFSGTANLSWKMFPDTLVYASYSRGYKAGGYNLDRTTLTRTISGTAAGGVTTAASTRDLQFAPETNDAFELGVKYNGRGIDINVAAFRQSFRNFQLNTFNGINFVVENINACSVDLAGADADNSGATGACTGKLKPGVRSTGMEFELFTRPLRDVSFNLGATYANTEYARNLVSTGGRPLAAALFQLSGRRISNSSEFAATASLGWTPQIGTSGLRGLFYVDARHTSAINTGSDLDIEKLQKGFQTVNGRIGLRGPNDRWAVELWAQNLLDKNYIQVGFDGPLQGSGTYRGVELGAARGFYDRSTQLYGAFLGEPRTFGLTVRGRY